jgi:acid phosphatase family membrane protein YuiD
VSPPYDIGLSGNEYDAYKSLLRGLHGVREGFASPISALTAADAISTLLAAECVRAGMCAQVTLDLLAPLREALVFAVASKEQAP